jgi:hypothetical protein
MEHSVEISSGVDFGLCALSDNSVSAAAISRTARKIYLISTAAARHQHASSEKLSHMLLGPRGGCICLLVLSRCAAGCAAQSRRAAPLRVMIKRQANLQRKVLCRHALS